MKNSLTDPRIGAFTLLFGLLGIFILPEKLGKTGFWFGVLYYVIGSLIGGILAITLFGGCKCTSN